MGPGRGGSTAANNQPLSWAAPENYFLSTCTRCNVILGSGPSWLPPNHRALFLEASEPALPNKGFILQSGLHPPNQNYVHPIKAMSAQSEQSPLNQSCVWPIRAVSTHSELCLPNQSSICPLRRPLHLPKGPSWTLIIKTKGHRLHKCPSCMTVPLLFPSKHKIFIDKKVDFPHPIPGSHPPLCPSGNKYRS